MITNSMINPLHAVSNGNVLIGRLIHFILHDVS